MSSEFLVSYLVVTFYYQIQSISIHKTLYMSSLPLKKYLTPTKYPNKKIWKTICMRYRQQSVPKHCTKLTVFALHCGLCVLYCFLVSQSSLVLYKFIDKVKRIRSERLGITKGPYPLNKQMGNLKIFIEGFSIQLVKTISSYLILHQCNHAPLVVVLPYHKPLSHI